MSASLPNSKLEFTTEVIPVWAASIAIVTVDDDALEDKPVPPAIVSDCESKSTAPVPLSPARSKSCAVIFYLHNF